MFMLGMTLVGVGVFRYQQVAELAREGARYASVHGSQYASDTGNAAAAASDIYTNAISPKAVGLDPNSLSYTVQWGTASSGSMQWTSWDSSGKTPTSANPNSSPPGAPITNVVKVTVTYTWSPYVYKVGSLGLSSSSSSTMPMSY
jgi:hypothetical protein